MILQITMSRVPASHFLGDEWDSWLIGRIWLYRLGPGADFASSSCVELASALLPVDLETPASWEKIDTWGGP